MFIWLETLPSSPSICLKSSSAYYFIFILCGGYFSIYLSFFPLRKRKTLCVENSHRHPSRVEGGGGVFTFQEAFFFFVSFFMYRVIELSPMTF